MSNLAQLLDDNCDDTKFIITDNNHNTYVDLVEESYKIAHNIRKQYPKQTRIGIELVNGFTFISSYLGVLKAGCVAVLINHNINDSQRQFILNDSKCEFVINSGNYYSLLENGPKIIDTVEPSDPAFILYTSGSTKMKGVVIPHSHYWTINSRSKNKNLPYCRTLITTPLCHMNGLSNLEVSLMGKSSIVLMSKFKGELASQQITRYDINNISGVPSTIQLLIKHSKLESVKHINIASSPLTRKLYDEIKSINSQCTISNSYGSTEAGPGLFGKHDTLPTPELSVGYPLKGIDYRLVDNVLEVRSPSMSLGYTNETDNFTSDGYYITKDKFTVDSDGFYYFVGRSDDMFTCGGHNIFPRQIEQYLESHNKVTQACVIPLPDDIKQFKPYAFVTGNVIVEELTELLQLVLPYNSIPRRIWVIDEMPLNNVFKVDKKKLIELATEYIYNELRTNR